MKEPKAAHTVLEPLKNKLAMHSPTSTTQTGNDQSDYREESAQEKTEKDQQTRVLVNMLFARFKAIYTHRFASAYANADEVKLAKREWALAIKGYKEPLLAYAVEKAKEAHAWPPTIAEFLKLINTAYTAFGIPAPRAAYLEACQCRVNPLEFRWSHAAVYHAGAKTGWYNLRSEEEIRTWPAFEKHYHEVVDQIVRGEKLSVPKVALIENHQADKLTTLIPDLVNETKLPESEIVQLLYYMQKTQGTVIRARYRQVSQDYLNSKNISVTLPK